MPLKCLRAQYSGSVQPVLHSSTKTERFTSTAVFKWYTFMVKWTHHCDGVQYELTHGHWSVDHSSDVLKVWPSSFHSRFFFHFFPELKWYVKQISYIETKRLGSGFKRIIRSRKEPHHLNIRFTCLNQRWKHILNSHGISCVRPFDQAISYHKGESAWLIDNQTTFSYFWSYLYLMSVTANHVQSSSIAYINP